MRKYSVIFSKKEYTMLNLFLFLLLLIPQAYAGLPTKEKNKQKNAAQAQESHKCAICLSNINPNNAPSIVTLPCYKTHIFHRRCITKWFDKNASCPLCKTKIDLKLINFDKEFLKAVRNDDVMAVKKYLPYINDINQLYDAEGHHALYIAAGHEDDSDVLVGLLLSEGKANPNTLTKQGETALQEAAYHNNANVIRMLYSYGVDIDTQTQFGDTALHFAASNGNLDAVEALVNDCHAITNIVNKAGYTPLDKARTHKHHDVIFLLEFTLS